MSPQFRFAPGAGSDTDAGCDVVEDGLEMGAGSGTATGSGSRTGAGSDSIFGVEARATSGAGIAGSSWVLSAGAATGESMATVLIWFGSTCGTVPGTV